MSLADEVFTRLSLSEPLSLEVIRVALDDISTFDKKQHDYGPTNIAAFGEVGVIVRAQDKLARLRNLSKVLNPKAGEPSNESIEDSWRDLSVYGMIARLCLAKKWPGSPEQGAGG